jgi:hypothetical protein
VSEPILEGRMCVASPPMTQTLSTPKEGEAEEYGGEMVSLRTGGSYGRLVEDEINEEDWAKSGYEKKISTVNRHSWKNM